MLCLCVNDVACVAWLSSLLLLMCARQAGAPLSSPSEKAAVIKKMRAYHCVPVFLDTGALGFCLPLLLCV